MIAQAFPQIKCKFPGHFRLIKGQDKDIIIIRHLPVQNKPGMQTEMPVCENDLTVSIERKDRGKVHGLVPKESFRIRHAV